MKHKQNLHSHLHKDARFLLERFTVGAQSPLLSWLGQIIRTIEPSAVVIPTFAPHDMNLPTCVDPEFIIIDTINPDGLPPHSPPCPLYDCRVVEGALLRSGFRVWPIIPPLQEGLIWPLVLHVESDNVEHSFRLSLPNPVIPSIMSYASSVCNIKNHGFRDTVKLLALWAYSHGFHELTIPVLHLMMVQLVHHLTEEELPHVWQRQALVGSQHLIGARSNRSVSHRDACVFLPAYRRGLGDHFMLNTASAPVCRSSWGHVASCPEVQHLPLGSLLSHFFGYYSQCQDIATKSVIGIPTMTRADFDWRFPHLQQQAFIVADPFMVSHNHAAPISPAVLDAIGQRCADAFQQLQSSEPLVAIFHQSLYELSRIVLSARWCSVASWIPVSPQSNSVPDRESIIVRVNNAIQAEFSSRYQVEVFGSSRYQVDNPSSDVDLVIIDLDRMTGFEPTNTSWLPRIYNIRQVADTLRKAGFQKVSAVVGATVPIAKFHDRRTGLDCDININNQLGVINSDLLKQYCDISPRLRPMIRALKRWAKPLQLNNPSGRGRGSGGTTFSSYTLAVMTVAHFQSLELLPNLQGGFPGLPENDQSHVFWTITKNDQRVRCDTRYRPAGQVISTEYTLDELMLSWLNLWGNEFEYDKYMVDIKTPGGFQPKPPPSPRSPLARHRSGRSQDCPTSPLRPDGHAGMDASNNDEEVSEAVPPEDISIFSTDSTFCVVDPFVRTRNIAGNIKEHNLQRFIAECKRTISMLALQASIDDISPNTGPDPEFEGYVRRAKPKGKRGSFTANGGLRQVAT